MSAGTPRNLMLPGNPREQPKQLQPDFGYDNLYRTVAAVEIANLLVLAEIGLIKPEEIALLTTAVESALMEIPTSDVDERERSVTKHDIRAWVQLASEKLPLPLRRWLHAFLTSFDPLDTGRILQYQRAYNQATAPSLNATIQLLANFVRQTASQLQIGRTHGQHALPITIGFWLATILNRLVYNARMLQMFSAGLVGKISGAVGAYNAQIGLGVEGLCGGKTFETRVLETLGLKPARISTQILPPEPLAYFLHSYTLLSAALGQFGRDCRHLMRTEIAEIGEPYEEGQVGSSTMAHKRNPINFEKMESTWLKTMAEHLKVHLGLISEHQRDLTGSSLSRDYPTIVVNVQTQLNSLLRPDKKGVPFLKRLSVDARRCRANFDMSADVILAEPIYIALQMAGYTQDAHALVNEQAMPLAKKNRQPLMAAIHELANSQEELANCLDRIPSGIKEMLHKPELYTGCAEQKALIIADEAEHYLSCGE